MHRHRIGTKEQLPFLSEQKYLKPCKKAAGVCGAGCTTRPLICSLPHMVEDFRPRLSRWWQPSSSQYRRSSNTRGFRHIRNPPLFSVRLSQQAIKRQLGPRFRCIFHADGRPSLKRRRRKFFLPSERSINNRLIIEPVPLSAVIFPTQRPSFNVLTVETAA